MNLGRRPEGGFGSHEIEHGRGVWPAMPVSPKDQITAGTFCGGRAISIPSYILPYTTYTPCKSSLLLARFALPFVAKGKEVKAGHQQGRLLLTVITPTEAEPETMDVTVTGMKAKEHLGEREDERRNSTNVSSD